MTAAFRCFLIFMALAGASAQPAAAKSVEKEFAEAWASREARYAQELQVRQAEAREALDTALDALAKNSDSASAKLAEWMARTRALGIAAGHADLISKLRTLMKEKPSYARADFWMHDQADQIRSSGEDANRALLAAQHLEGLDDSAAFQKVNAAIIRAGAAQGQFDELTTENDQLTTYFKAKGEQDERRHRAMIGLLAALGDGLKSTAQQSQSFMMSCSTFGRMTNCTGN